MNFRQPFLYVAGLFLLGAGLLPANDLELAGVPAGLPARTQSALRQKRAALQGEWSDFQRDYAAMVAQYNGALEGSAAAATGQRRKAELQQQASRTVTAADEFNEHIEKWLQWLDLGRQLAEIPKQLAGLGFTRANHDFTWYQGQSGQARDQMIAQLVSRVGSYATAKAEEAATDHFLEKIRTMSKHDADKLAQKFVDLHMRNHVFQEWLRSFSPKVSRAVLVNGAKEAIDYVKREEAFLKTIESLDKGTVAGRQEAFLTVVSLLVDYPGMKELKALSAGLYDVGEAWATIYILDRGIDELMNSTEIQLANQKRLILHQEKLMTERKKLAATLAGYP
jgi:hypothetical protein